MDNEWGETMCVQGIEHGNRVHVAERIGISWMALNRIQGYKLGHDFTNTINLDEVGDGKLVFDLTSCRFGRIDYVHGKHGCFHIALMHDDSDIFVISMIDRAKGLALCSATKTIQKKWRKKLVLRRDANMRSLCLNLASTARYTYYIDPFTRKQWWWIDVTGEWGWC
jgi:hypothetical protein